ncbi:MAG TPA: hypothetical protein VJU77_19175 [Chthoniobacterales bacterium]|nr:hypothetical protein [Chthoniobacterales bacterium]
MSLLDRYLTAVRFWLPKSQRDDIAAELAANLQSEIDDRAATLGRPLNDTELAALLKQHGPPIVVASRYRGEHRTVNFGRQLIGPLVFPFYWTALKVTLVLLLIPRLISTVSLISGGVRITELGRTVGHVAWNALPALLFVTAVFALIDWNLRRFHLLENWSARWKPESLPPAERQQKQIPRSSSIAGIIFHSLFILWWMRYASIPLLVITKAGAQVHFAPVLASLYLPILVSAFLCLAQNWINLVEPGWRWLRPLVGIITSLIGVFIFYSLFKTPELITITDQNGIAISPGAAAKLHRLLPVILGSIWLAMLIAAISYAWQLIWIIWKSIPRPPVAPSGKGISLV